jgi:hypothetical protein
MEIWVHIVIILVILAIVAVIAAICCTTTCIDGGALDNDIPVDSIPVDSIPVDSTSVKATPVDSIPVDSTPVKATPVDSTSVKATPVDSTSVKATPVKATPVKATPVKATPLIRVKAKPVDDRISNFNSAINMIKNQFPALTIDISYQYSATVFTPDYTHKFSIFGLNPTLQSIIPKFQIEYPNLDTSDFNTLDELSTAIQTYLNTSPNNMVLNQPNQLTPGITSNKPKKINLLNNVRNISKKIQHGICNIL